MANRVSNNEAFNFLSEGGQKVDLFASDRPLGSGGIYNAPRQQIMAPVIQSRTTSSKTWQDEAPEQDPTMTDETGDPGTWADEFSGLYGWAGMGDPWTAGGVDYQGPGPWGGGECGGLPPAEQIACWEAQSAAYDEQGFHSSQIGCLDPTAANYDPSALAPCDDCCSRPWGGSNCAPGCVQNMDTGACDCTGDWDYGRMFTSREEFCQQFPDICGSQDVSQSNLQEVVCQWFPWTEGCEL